MKGYMRKGTVYSLFVVFCIMMFGFFILDLSMCYVYVFNAATGQLTIEPVINLIPQIIQP